MTNCPLSGRGQSHVTHSRISHPRNTSGTAERVVQFCVVQATSNVSLQTAEHPRKGVASGYVIRFRILHSLNFSGMAEDRTSNFVHGLAREVLVL